MQRNRTGSFSTSDYVLGRGVGLVASMNSADYYTSGFRDLGNIPGFGLSIESSTEQHFSSRSGARVQDAVFLTSNTVGGTLQLETATLDNLAVFLSGILVDGDNTVTAVLHSASNGLPFVTEGTGASTDTVPVAGVRGRWFRLFDKDYKDGTAKRVYGLRKTGTGTATITVGTCTTTGASYTTLSASDYVLDMANGLVFIKNTANLAGYTGGTCLGWKPTTVGSDTVVGWSYDELQIFQQPSAAFGFMFHGENPQNPNQRFEIFLPKVRMTANGELGLITETDAIQIPVTLSIEPNEAMFPSTPYGWVRSYQIA